MSEPIELIVGLGNPGSRYEQTRHNAGFWLLDALAESLGSRFSVEGRFFGLLGRVEIDGQRCYLFKPTTFMNRSGQALAALTRYYKIPAPRVLVVHDEIDLPPGVVRLKRGGGHGGHNGLRDIIKALGDSSFWRLRLGVGHPGARDDVVDYVLHPPATAERALIEDAIAEALGVLPQVVRGEQEKAMHILHSTRT
ncbi:MAG: aminoacyl-tRNA hydrolase [Gammaproteobacteria bacterium]